MEAAVSDQLLKELAEWRPPGGVVSAYVSIDPGDRGEGWRIELRHALEGLDDDAARRIAQRFPDNSPLPHGRTQIGFLEVGGSEREIWRGFQLDGRRTEVVHGERPLLAASALAEHDGAAALLRYRFIDCPPSAPTRR